MGQTLTVETDGKNSLAATQGHKEVADDLADADKAMVADTWNEIAWLYAQVNAGPGVLAPLAAYEEPEDLNKQADLDKKLVEIGAEFTEEHFTGKYGLKPGEFRVRGAMCPRRFRRSRARTSRPRRAKRRLWLKKPNAIWTRP